ncbi:hypothetical protein [uncultured Zobellia sp.]|uniref:hypothetical protein n=1 Tax=uncultured Zobellia sp. TaxID=255433 RepID=UPI00259339E6|nr:hypothetical protein [uncultured Zobellia sp.]
MESVSEIYTFIGQKIMDSIPEDWTSAKLNIESVGNHVKSHGIYIDITSEQKNLAVKLGFQGAKNILRLKEIAAENDKNKWNKAVFSLKPDGDFNMEFIWDQELQDEVESF